MSRILVVYLNSAVGIASDFKPAGPEFEYSRNFCCYKRQYIFSSCCFLGFFLPKSLNFFCHFQVESMLVFHNFEKYKTWICMGHFSRRCKGPLSQHFNKLNQRSFYIRYISIFRNSTPAPHLTNYFSFINSLVLHSHKLAKIGHLFCFYFFI